MTVPASLVMLFAVLGLVESGGLLAAVLWWFLRGKHAESPLQLSNNVLQDQCDTLKEQRDKAETRLAEIQDTILTQLAAE